MISPKFKSFIRDYFTLTSRERKGALMLVIVICIQLLILIWMNYIKTPDSHLLEKYKTTIVQFERETQNEKSKNLSSAGMIPAEKNSPEIPDKILTPFNPNTIRDDEWIAMGLTAKQTHVIRNYLNKGGVFRRKEDLLKIYGLDQSLVEKLTPFIVLKDTGTSPPFKESYHKVVKKEPSKINLNSADTVQLLELPLVGPGRARMIYKYREALGGFYSINQLMEVFTIDSTTFDQIAPHVLIDTAAMRKININSDQLKHPYISKQLETVLKAYRKQHGNFTQIAELKRISLITDQLLSKLVPYVAFE